MRNIWRGLLLGACLCSAAQAEDWTYWRGPEYNGISREKNLVDTWSLETGENVLWTSPIGGRAAPIVLNGRVYLNCRTEDDINDPQQKIHAQEQVVCWDADTGDVLWKDRFNVFQTDIPAPRVGWASMVGDSETGNVYVHSVSGLFRCYSGDGKVLWENSLFEDYGKISGYGGRTQTPIIDEDRVIVSFLASNWGATAGPPKHAYYAFDKRNGELLWVSAPGGRPLDTNYSCPVIAVINGQRMLIGGNGDGGVYAINARTGQKIWGFLMSRRGLNATPVVWENKVYIAHGEDNIDNALFGRVQCIDATGAGDVTTSHSLWRVDDIKAGYTALLVKDGVLYVVADTGNLHAFDANTGEPLWVHDLGTVGKGSPTWGDGKMYVMEVNGNVHILKPTREGCETLSHVTLQAASGPGTDEIYASPSIANGKVYLVTRDRTICLGRKDAVVECDPIPPLPPEAEPGDVALLQLAPYETRVLGGGKVSYRLRGYDKNGRFIKEIQDFQLTAGDGLGDVSVQGDVATIPEAALEQAGEFTATVDGLKASARLRVFPALPWSWDFTGMSGKQTPPTWIGAAGKLTPTPENGDTVMKCSLEKGRPSAYFWLGPSDMHDYVIQADVRLEEEKRNLPSVGITAQRYNLILKGNYAKLTVQSWAPHLRMAKEVKFRCDPDVWYTLKLRVQIKDDGAHVQGKVWPRSEPEPEAWTVEQVDPHPNAIGSPGLYVYGVAPTFFDNVQVRADN